MSTSEPGLGELLRHVSELVEQGAEAHYRAMQLPLLTPYRTRYTPVLRALHAGANTVTEITARSRLTQGAISQTVSLLEADGLVARHALPDGRKSGIGLTAMGAAVVEQLEAHWAVTFVAIARLEDEIGHPLRQVLDAAGRALEREGFAARLAAARGDAR